MTRLAFRLTMLVFTLVLMAALLARTHGQADPPAAAGILTRSGCALPCLVSVVPGMTSGEALAQLAASGAEDIRGPYDGLYAVRVITFVVRNIAGGRVIGLVGLDVETGQRVDTVRVSPLDMYANIDTLSDLLLSPYGQSLGASRVFRTCDGILPRRMLFIFGHNAELVAELRPLGQSLGTPLQPGTPLLSVVLNAPRPENLQSVQSNFGCSVEVEWRGFAALWRYFGAGLYLLSIP